MVYYGGMGAPIVVVHHWSFPVTVWHTKGQYHSRQWDRSQSTDGPVPP